ncbi:MAG: hypothetical protein K2Y28_06045 [Burkholderiaceae bacterium]|nr:hypothetical protein [Burkholderiaceae bacterium]
MTKNISELTSPAARLFAQRCIEALPALHENGDFLQTVERIFQDSFVRYVNSDLSFIRQMHIIAFPENDQHIAVIYLMFSDGRVQGFKLTGSYGAEAASVRAVVNEIECLAQAEGDRVDAIDRESQLAALLARQDRIGIIISHFQRESYTPTGENLTVALNSICHVLVRAIDVKIKLSPTAIGAFGSLVAEAFPSLSSGSDKLNEFVCHLDAGAVAAIGELKQVVNRDSIENSYDIAFDQLSTYNYFAVGNPILKRRRVEAISAFPWMAPYVMEYVQGQQKFSEAANFDLALSSASLCHWGQPLSETIDAGRPLISAAANLFGVADEVIEWSRGRPIIFHAPVSLKKIDDLLRVLSFLRPEDRPDSASGWRDLRSALSHLLRSLQYCLDDGDSDGDAFDDDERNTNLLAMPNMQQILRQRFEELYLMKTSLGKVKNWFWMHFTGGGDFLATMRDAAKARCAEYNDKDATETTRSSAMLIAWQAERTLREIGDASLRWYIELQEELALLGDASAAVRPIVLQKPFELDEVHVVQITNYQQLVDEVRAMHCDVARYKDFCFFGASQIFSIRNRNNVRQSTLELSSCVDEVDVKSHYGFENAKPSDLCKKAATTLVEFLNSLDCSKLFDGFRHVSTVNFNRRKAEAMTRKGAVANFDIVAEAVAWRCAFTSEQEAQRFLERFRTD